MVAGLVDGMLTALTLACDHFLHPGGGMSVSLACRVALAAGLPSVIVVFSAGYARQRQEILRMAYQLNLDARRQLLQSNLGRQALHGSVIAALTSGAYSFLGALLPLLAAEVLGTSAWSSVGLIILLLGALGAVIGRLTASSQTGWALALMLAGSGLAWLGIHLQLLS